MRFPHSLHRGRRPAHPYFECLWVDKTANKIAAHTNSDDTLVRLNRAWLIKEMKAAIVPEH
jgi:hypothetical protein